MSEFLRDTKVDGVGGGRYQSFVNQRWWVVQGPNGGYLAAIVVRAMKAELADPERLLRSITLHYLRAPVEGAVETTVKIVRQGRRVATVRAVLTQGGRECIVAIATFATSGDALEFSEVSAPKVRQPEEIDPPDESRLSKVGTVPISDRFQQRLCIGMNPLDAVSSQNEGGPANIEGESRPALSGGWMRLAEPTAVDEAVLAAMCDAWFPPIFAKFPRVPLAVPTVDLTLHILQLPEDEHGWVLGEFWSPVARGGYLVEEGNLWDQVGNLLARSRQLAVFA